MLIALGGLFGCPVVECQFGLGGEFILCHPFNQLAKLKGYKLRFL